MNLWPGTSCRLILGFNPKEGGSYLSSKEFPISFHGSEFSLKNVADKLRHADLQFVRNHLDLLIEHGVIVPQGEGYGTVFFLSAEMEADYQEFEQIWVKIGKKGITTANKERDET